MSTCADCGFEGGVVCQPGHCGFALGRRQWQSLQDQLAEMTRHHDDVLTNLEQEVARTGELEREIEYYKKLAHLWEVACQDLRVFKPGNVEEPLSYAYAVTYSHERIVAVVELPAKEAAAAVFERVGAKEALDKFADIGTEIIKETLGARLPEQTGIDLDEPLTMEAWIKHTAPGDRELMLEALHHYQNHLQKGVTKMQKARMPIVIQQAFASESSPYIDRVDSLFARLSNQEREEDDEQ